MKHIRLHTIILLLLMAGYSALRAASKVDQCARCHADLDEANAAIVSAYQKDIHFQKGLMCSSCHGGNPAVGGEEAMDPEQGFVGTPLRKDIPSFCGKCHSDANYMRHYNPRLSVDQEEKYRTSHHGKLLAQGDRKVATCVSCHGVHGILPAENTASPVHKQNIPSTCNRCHGDRNYMASYGIPTNQFEEYSQSVHGIALLQKNAKGAPACNDCHGNHGASPPGVDDVAAVCILCHSFNGDLFNRSPHRDAFREAGISQCAACHGHHQVLHPTDDMLGAREGGVCGDCHSEGDPGFISAERMRQLLDSLLAEQTRAKTRLAKARSLDMDVSEGETALEDVRESLIECRTAVHTFSDEEMGKVSRKGFEAAARADSIARAAIFEHRFRRMGFGVSTLILTGLALLLWLKIRQIERRARTA